MTITTAWRPGPRYFRAGRLVVALLAVMMTSACGRLGFDDPLLDGPPGLVAAFTLDQLDGTTLEGSTPNLTGTCMPACPTPAPGVRGDGLHFDGTQGIILATASASLVDPAHPYTVTVWVKTTVPVYSMNPVAQPFDRIVSTDSFAINLESPAKVQFETTPEGAEFGYAYAAGTSINDDTWHHIAARWSGSRKDLFLDGVSVAFTDNVTAAPSSEAIYLGIDLDYGAVANPMIGTLDELAFFDRALSAADIATLAEP